ncbi:hypothetical protein CR513_16567, partial [Mucuna pruriens]
FVSLTFWLPFFLPTTSSATIEGCEGDTIGDSSEEFENHSPKTRMMIKQIKRLEAKIGERLERVKRENREDLYLVKKDTQSVNDKVEALSRERDEHKGPFMHESKRSHDEGISERNDRQERHGRHRRVKDKLGREKMDGMKCKIPPFLGESKPYSCLD